MAGFDPDAYLAAQPAFDPDAYLGVKTAPKTSLMQDIKQGAGNLAAGALRGAGSIGATILAPIDIASDALAGKGLSLESNRQRRADMDSALGNMGAETDSLLYQGGKLAGEIAGTAGAGGVVANGVTRALPFVSKVAPTVATKGAALADAIRTGGMVANGAGMGTRTAGGAINGLVTAGLANPEDAGMGAVLGGALPGAIKTAGVAGSLAKQGAGAVVKNTLGLTSGVGGEAVGTAYQAGKSGGTNFLDNMRGNVPLTDVLDDAKSALTKMRIDRGAQYRQGMAGVSADKTVVDFAPIESAVNSIKSMGNYKGQVINKNASGAVDEITDLVTQWKGLDPKEFHTPEGLDALKQAIGDIRDNLQFNTPARKAADTAYNAVKSEINTQAPTYAKVMKDYSEASETLKEVERALSLGQKSAADTSMRKLQSLMRNNVNTNYGNRLDLAKTLEQNGAEILPAVAGQQMSSLTPRGLQGLAATGASLASLTNPATLAALPFTSPRLIGEAAYGLGSLNRGASNAGSATAKQLAALLRGSNAAPVSMSQFAPLLAATPILAANQK